MGYRMYVGLGTVWRLVWMERSGHLSECWSTNLDGGRAGALGDPEQGFQAAALSPRQAGLEGWLTALLRAMLAGFPQKQWLDFRGQLRGMSSG